MQSPLQLLEKEKRRSGAWTHVAHAHLRVRDTYIHVHYVTPQVMDGLTAMQTLRRWERTGELVLPQTPEGVAAAAAVGAAAAADLNEVLPSPPNNAQSGEGDPAGSPVSDAVARRSSDASAAPAAPALPSPQEQYPLVAGSRACTKGALPIVCLSADAFSEQREEVCCGYVSLAYTHADRCGLAFSVAAHACADTHVRVRAHTQAIRAGFDAYLTKPVRFSDFEQYVRSLLGERPTP